MKYFSRPAPRIPNPASLSNRGGFSLAEILIVVAIAASLIMVASNLNGGINILNGLVGQQLQSKSDIDQTLQIMASEARSAGLSQNGAYPIDAASSSSISFYSDITKSGIVDHVRYFFASSTIYKGVIAPTGTPAAYPTSSEVVSDIIDGVIAPATSTPLFSYYDGSYTGTQAAMTSSIVLAGIRLIGVSFFADVKPQQSPGPEYFSMLIDIRNLRTN